MNATDKLVPRIFLGVNEVSGTKGSGNYTEHLDLPMDLIEISALGVMQTVLEQMRAHAERSEREVEALKVERDEARLEIEILRERIHAVENNL